MNVQRYRRNRESRSGGIAIRRMRSLSKAAAAARATTNVPQTFAQHIAQSMSRKILRCVPHAQALPTRLFALLKRVLGKLGGRALKLKRRRKLRLLEIQQLGEKRFVALMRAGKQTFLIGGAASSVCLLAELPSSRARTHAARPVERA